ncbi:bifunctional lysylphosphatidylglycerol flippase/synthetase MprF [Neobacillus sp. OS1-2]|uniref:bifunctional lysylphosphatidylglycerol flippase/synthetase MprF n=1 Tax=Neobacillus sp. OS1-2 TaxID=3070680 RepID=UPI0027DF0721|nr:bifunctional lysylphosphatidylglycerol flippase/synthetase MprF [Neobacillus sp. OS1-2]WML40167.1 bifunctional lysylphosphatidylglycerol flippase/synthetase MprF [Neobacillus sp. OS1-2]
MGIKKEKVLKVAKFIFPLLLLIFAIIEIRKFTGNLNGQLLKNEINQLNIWSLLLILVVTFAAVLPMLLYDVILVRILKLKVSRRELLEQSFIANSFSNLIGFGGLIGAMLRTYFFHKLEKDKRRLLGIIASVSLYYLTGISLLTWIVTIHYRNFPLFVETKWLYFAVVGVGLYLPVFLVIHMIKSKKDNQTLITTNETIKLVIVSVVEWFAVFIAIFVLSRILGISITFENLFPVYVVAACAGIISMIPGGLGSFDLVFIWGMQDLHVPEEKFLVLLLLYRIGYYFIPFLVSLIFFVKLYWQRWNQSWNYLPKAIVQGLSHVILTMLVFLSGLILLLSASVPGIMSRLKIAQELLSFPIINVSHQLSVAAGFLLLGLSRGIEYSVKRTYDLTMLALILAALFSIFKGIDYEEAIFLIIVALLLRISKGQFYRESYVLTWGKTIFDVTVILVLTSMYILIGYLNLPIAKLTIPTKFIPYVIVDYRDLFKSAGIGLVIAVLILFAGYLISLPKKWKFERSIGHEKEIMSHFTKYKGKVLSHLIFLHDKYIFWNSGKNVLIPFQKYADKLVILGDPVGEKKELSNAIEEFQEIADLYGYTPVFYQVSDEMLPYLHGHGFAFFKLGEEAFVDLKTFTLSGNKMKGLRALKNKFSRDQFHFELVKPPFSSELLGELRGVSNEWLQGRKEKAFSLGFFDEHYLNKAPIAIVTDENKRILGFMSIMHVYDDYQTISVDLMRVIPDAPSGTIDFLFLSLIDWAKGQGYERFNMGMAPLSNVGLSRFSFLSEKIAAQIFLHGHFIYHFQGLRKFKQKYTNSWEPKYLAYRRKSSLPFIMAQITLLISKKRT